MDTNTQSLKENAYKAASNVSEMQTSAPGLLSELKRNLVGIFAKDNPVLEARDNALTKFLSTPSQSRADLLPGNMPTVEGRALTLSPTQQNAITTGRSSAALAPLIGLNEIVKGIFGNIGEMVQGAGGIYDAQLKGAQSNASNYLDLYKAAVAEDEAKRKAAESTGFDFNALLNMIGGGLNTNAAQDPNDIADSIYGTGGSNTAQNQMDPTKWSINPTAPINQNVLSASGVPDVVRPGGGINFAGMNLNQAKPTSNLSIGVPPSSLLQLFGVNPSGVGRFY